jgi:hypothetical protein
MSHETEANAATGALDEIPSMAVGIESLLSALVPRRGVRGPQGRWALLAEQLLDASLCGSGEWSSGPASRVEDQPWDITVALG